MEACRAREGMLLGLSVLLLMVGGSLGNKITSKMGNGEIVDCIDFDKHPAFNESSMNNRKILKEHGRYINHQAQRPGLEPHLDTVGYPTGTVAIKRTTSTWETAANPNLMIPVVNFPTADDGDVIRKSTFWSYRMSEEGEYYGAIAQFSIHSIININGSDQYSGAVLAVVDSSGKEEIFVGWMVSFEQYQDFLPRFTVHWQSNGKGCWNMVCSPGYEHTSTKTALGAPFTSISTIDGEQFTSTFGIFKDPAQNDRWMVATGNNPDALEPVGYISSSLFSALAGSADHVVVGGYVFSPPGTHTPSMGSGRMAAEGYRKAAFVNNILTIDENNGHVKPPASIFNLELQTDTVNYSLGELVDEDGGLHFFYGGPGGTLVS